MVGGASAGDQSPGSLANGSSRKEPRLELGLYTFADVGPEIDPARRLRNLLEEAELADQLGLDVFGVGEHHRPDFAVSSPAVALDRKSTRLNSSHANISYAVFCL